MASSKVRQRQVWQRLVLIGVGLVVFSFGYMTGRQAIACPPVASVADAGDVANGSAPTVPPDMTPTPDSPSAELIDRVIQKAAETADVAAAELRVVRYSRATWPDGCLGLAGADELCTQALVEGWQFEVAHSGNPGNGIYRSDLSGDRIRLDQSGF